MSMIYSLTDERVKGCKLEGFSIGHKIRFQHTAIFACPIWNDLVEPTILNGVEGDFFCSKCGIESYACPALIIDFKRLHLVDFNVANKHVEARVSNALKSDFSIINPLAVESIICNRGDDLREFLGDSRSFCCDGHTFKDTDNSSFTTIFECENRGWKISRDCLKNISSHSLPTICLDLYSRV